MSKKNIIKCMYCKWTLITEKTEDIMYNDTKLHQLPKSCASCSGPKQFRCPSCGRPAKLLPIK